jgi:hypothetical protein
MHVTLFGVVLFLHIFVVIGSFMMAAVLHAALPALARARDVREMRAWATLVHRLEPLLPISALFILGFGAWLIHLSKGRIDWSDGWLLTSVITFVLIEGLAGAVLSPRSKALVAAVEHAPDGPVSDELRQVAVQPLIWHVAHLATFSFAGVVFLMSARPATVWSVAIVVVGGAIGLAASAAQLRRISPVADSSGAPLRAEAAH